MKISPRSYLWVNLTAGSVVGLASFVVLSIYQFALYYLAISLVGAIAMGVVFAIRRQSPNVFLCSLVGVGIFLSTFALWIFLTSGVEAYRNDGLHDLIPIDRAREKLDTHEFFRGSKILERKFMHDSAEYISEIEYVLSIPCTKSIENALRKTMLDKDTTRICTPWHGYMIFCDEFLARRFIRLEGQDTVFVYSNAIYSTKLTPKNRFKISLMYIGDTMYSVLDTNKPK